ncbi:MAG: dUTP diphosphatase, partial [Deltaproteobacteria bacterium]|nr:dUTP diphosphatase [Deltaproteobacteria bacterium]
MATPGAVGLDLRSCADQQKAIAPGERLLIGTGIAIEPKEPGVAG